MADGGRGTKKSKKQADCTSYTKKLQLYVEVAYSMHAVIMSRRSHDMEES